MDRCLRRANGLGSLDSQDKIHERIGRVDGVVVGQRLRWPHDARVAGGPNSKKRPPVRRPKSPSRDEVWHRRAERLNKELANDLRGRVTVEVGGFLIWMPGGFIGQKKKGM